MARVSGKLTGRALGWDRNAIGTATKRVPQDTGRVLIGRIAGIVAGFHQTVNNDTGEVQIGLKGQFRGVSSLNEMVQDGNKVGADKLPVMIDSGNPIVVSAGRCYLPGGLQEMIETAYKDAIKTDKDATVSFALDLFAIPATNKAGYSYDGDMLVEATEQDPLDMLFTNANAVTTLPGSTTMAAIEAQPVDAALAPAPAAEPASEPAPDTGKGKSNK